MIDPSDFFRTRPCVWNHYEQWSKLNNALKEANDITRTLYKQLQF